MPLRFYPSRPRSSEPNPKVVWSIGGWPPQIQAPEFGEDAVTNEKDTEPADE